MTGYLHLPPIWVLDTFDHGNLLLNAVDQNIDLTLATDIVSAHAISDEIAVGFSRDGLVTFVYADGAAIGGSGSVLEMLADRLSVANAHIACLHSAIGSVDGAIADGDAVTHLTAVHGRSTGLSAHDSSVRALLTLPSGRDLNPTGSGLPYVEVTWVPLRHPISRSAVEASIERLAEIASRGIACLRRYELLLQAGVAMRESNYALALITASALAEHAALRLWQQKASEIGQATGGIVTNDAFSRLGSNYLLALLRLSDAVSEPLYLDLDRTRKARNNWVHGLSTPSIDEATTAQRAAAQAMAIADGLNFVVWPTLPLTSLRF